MYRAMTAAETLRAARDLIADETRWTRWTRCDFARDKHGAPVYWRDDQAVCFCAVGALCRAQKHGESSPALNYLRLAAKTFAGASMTFVNDYLGHDAVLTMYDLAISMAEEDLAIKAESGDA